MKKTIRSSRSSITDHPILVSGIQPTGRLHLGNYLGALKNFVDLQNSGKYQCRFFIADLHALTENPSAEDLNKNIVSLAADFLTVGLNPKKSIIFQQSQIPAHEKLAKILESLAPFGETRRMTQFKEKSKDEKENANVGLFTYPILMAADILLYDASFVPVGDDQLQHLELARTLARKFNAKFGQTFIEPKALLTKTARLMSLDDPTKKMSKSRPAGCIFIDDEPKVIEEKIRTAVTDSGNEIKYDPQNKPAISNLMMIYAELTPPPVIARSASDEAISRDVIASGSEAISQKLKAIENQFRGKGYAEFKKSLAKVIGDYFAPFRKKKAALLGSSLRLPAPTSLRGAPATKQSPEASLRGSESGNGNLSKLKQILKSGSTAANKIAAKKITMVKEKIGLSF